MGSATPMARSRYDHRASGSGGIATGIAAATLIGAVAYGGVKTKTNSSDEHPFRERILKPLMKLWFMLQRITNQISEC